MFRPLDEKYMSRAIGLAERGRPWAHPNPVVGCVVVNGTRVAGEGWHARFGGPHAEVMALGRAGRRAQGATVYVTLEPCTHWGQTPPCVDGLIRAGVSRVVVAGLDPSPRVHGKGMALLKKAGIRVAAGCLEEKAESLNRPFFSRHRRGRPWVVLKLAQTLDGRLASRTGVSRWITGPAARAAGHQLRAASDGVLVGAETVRRDNPALTAHGLGPNPVRIVLSGHLGLPPRAKVWRTDAPTWILTTEKASAVRRRRWERAGGAVVPVPGVRGVVDLKAALSTLARRGICQLLVEGGGKTAHAFLSKDLVDEVYLFVSPSFLGSGGRSSVEGPGWTRPEKGPRLKGVTLSRVGDDGLIHGFVRSK